MPSGVACATSGATAQPIVPTPAIATAAPGRIFMTMVRRLIAAMCLLPCLNFFGALQRPTFIGQRRLVLRHFKLFSAFFIEVRQTLAHLNSNRLVEQSGYSSERLRVFSDQLPRVRR